MKTFKTALELDKEIKSVFPNKIVKTINGLTPKLLIVSRKHVQEEWNGELIKSPYIVEFN